MSSQNTDQNEALAIGAEPQLFVDDTIVSAKCGVVRKLHPGKKLAQPVLLPDRPWEGGRVYIYGTVHYDADAQQFRMWYLTRIGRGSQHRAPGLRELQGDLILYATSSDGLNWEKPELGLHEFDGSRANNILLFDKHSPTVIVDETADPSERYKMAAWDWSRDQFGGTVETVPLTLPSGQLVVNADASQGSLVVELLSPEGETVPGYSSQDCTAIDSDSVRHVIRWQDNQRLPTGQQLRLRFHLDTAQLYSFRVNTAEHE